MIPVPVSLPGSGDGFGRAGDEPSASMPPLAAPNPSTRDASFVNPGMTTTEEWSLVVADVMTNVLPLGLVAVATPVSAVLIELTMSPAADGTGNVIDTGALPSTDTLIVLWLVSIVKEAGGLLVLLPLPKTALASRLTVTKFDIPLIMVSTNLESVLFIDRPLYCSTVLLPLASGTLVTVTENRLGSALG